MFSTFKESDAKLLLKDITGMVRHSTRDEREMFMQNGGHYSEVLPIEEVPSSEYLAIYKSRLEMVAKKTALAIENVTEQIWEDKGENVVIVSLARAGISTGILIKRRIESRYNVKIEHYAISIIRDRGIDRNAMRYILNRHNAKDIQFVDGWTGKGTIQRELEKAMSEYNGVNYGLAVISDPAYVADKCGTHKDFLIASACLNATISGLISRTVYGDSIAEKGEYHGAVFYSNLIKEDLTYDYINAIESQFSSGLKSYEKCECISDGNSISTNEIKEVANMFHVDNINLIKPSIGETTRVLLRRVPSKILVYCLEDYENLGHIYRLAEEKGVEVVEYPLKNYKACGIIREVLKQ